MNNSKSFKEKSLLWLCKNFTYVFAFNGNGYSNGFETFFFASNSLLKYNNLKSLKALIPNKNTCLAISYDVKNEIEKLQSKNKTEFDFQSIICLQSEVKLSFSDTKVTIESNIKNPITIFNSINRYKFSRQFFQNPSFKSRTSKEEYLEKVDKIKQHIVEGDIYEMCYCMEFLANEYTLHSPAALYSALCTSSPKPFASFLKSDNNYLIGASPERFIKLVGDTIYSQPIKGTIARSENFEEDVALKQSLLNSKKDQSENLMIVDLVRNDLSKVCKTGGVNVEDLFGVYSYPGVHQMISTIKGELKNGIGFYEIIEASFPMGSMTGAPKIKAMELIDKFENFQRGLYSGTIGYFTENGFDFNVGIRSLQYNDNSKSIGYHVGSAITFESDAEKEYEECILKADSLLQLFTS